MKTPPESLIFMMGEYRAEFPLDRLYVTNHMWAIQQGGARFRFGFSAYAIRLLQDVYFLEWDVEPPATIRSRQNLGSIESKKAESDLFAPAAGSLVKLNEEALHDPTVINVDPYGEGWLFEIDADQPDLLSPAAYIEHLEQAWKVAERTIKGQVH